MEKLILDKIKVDDKKVEMSFFCNFSTKVTDHNRKIHQLHITSIGIVNYYGQEHFMTIYIKHNGPLFYDNKDLEKAISRAIGIPVKTMEEGWHDEGFTTMEAIS